MSKVDSDLLVLLMAFRQALLMINDALERYLHITPRTAELRRGK